MNELQIRIRGKMRNIKNFFPIALVFVFLILSSCTASATEIIVDDNPDANFRSIQEAVNNSVPWDTVILNSQISEDSDKDGIGYLPYNENGCEFDYLPLMFVSSLQKPLTPVNNESGTNSNFTKIIVQGPEDFPVADFNANPTSGYAPLYVQFTDSSQNANQWYWNFGDGTTSYEQNPTHNYSAGIYPVTLTVSNAYSADSKYGMIIVLKSTPTITWNSPAAMAYGTSLSSTQLNAVATNPATGKTVNGAFVYTPAAGTVLSAGTQILHAEFTPYDTANYDTASKDVTIYVAIQTTPTITWSNPADITNGEALSNTQLNAVATDPVTGNRINGAFVYTPAAGTVLLAGAYTLRADFTSFDTANYTKASKYVTINVTNQTTPTITWSNPADIIYGTALSSTQLNAVATDPVIGNTVNGTFVYTPISGTVLGVGERTLHVDFTPADTANYITASKDVTINVIKATPTITWSNPAAIVYGTALNGSQLNASASVPGIFVYNPPSGTVLSAGTQILNVDFTPEDSANYTTISTNVTIIVEAQILPVANLTASATEGYAPFSVLFTDTSQYATARTWDFNNDGVADSSDLSPVYTYDTAGNYTVNLNVSNTNGTVSKNATITVLKKSSSSGGSSSSSGGSGGGGGAGGAGGSPEPQSNVATKEISQAFVTSGNSIKFDFPRDATPVVYITFNSKKTAGKTTTIVEMLKGKSTLVSGLPSNEVYKSLNIWVGNSGFATPSNIENSVICFKVEKSWTRDKNITQSSINLYRYNDKKWNQLQTSLLREDDKCLLFYGTNSWILSLCNSR